MRTTQTFSISFFIRKKKNQPDQALIYTRITVNGKSKEVSLKRALHTEKWNQTACKMIGTSIESQQVNRKIDDVRSKLYNIYEELLRDEQIIDAEIIKNRFLGIDKTHNTLISLLDYHNLNMKSVLKYGTLKNYNTTESYLKEYLKSSLKVSDLYLKHIDYEFTLGFERFLRAKASLNNNGVMKHMERFKKVMRLAVDLDWIEKNPTLRFKLRFDKVDMIYLNKQDLSKLKNATFNKVTHTTTRDIFVFACYTGLAFADTKSLKKDNLQIGIDGKKWIYTRRLKTNTQVRIPLLNEAEIILDFYKNHPRVIHSDLLLPVYSNQKINQYLKEIAIKLKIKKKLSFHTARHTFATTVTLANGVPIETVSKILGHHKIATTQIYARVIDSKISNDIDVLREKLG
ncbi:site-specific integrase [Leeuwenhoekiella marinoflava]|uniref:Site-specific recombinase XerD n=2 Tax=Leeuwenhoekiella marinoflava TaxID=988 RepID=A0A4Q0P5J3_9FLAO|nr:site-specific integrase [Leeuwenhoekiella marinoflava]RXG21883.1 site-specific recombinase XerD [Leeuwenhoekiella marinoflava]SHG01459.1 Site-specific recombinase XerD [Leeuwenhoekiella marinoflava DSM 3653]